MCDGLHGETIGDVIVFGFVDDEAAQEALLEKSMRRRLFRFAERLDRFGMHLKWHCQVCSIVLNIHSFKRLKPMVHFLA